MIHIALIGMSNIGKSYWARRLGAQGYRLVDCDALIAGRVMNGVATDPVRALADWMGYPGTPDYATNSRRYATAEQAVMQAALDDLTEAQPTVIDTTGSVIYCADATLTDLTSRARVVYLDTSAQHIDALYRQYATRPKPVLWDTHYQPLPNETPEAARQRCYPHLLHDRARRYRALAHVTVPFDRHKDRRATAAGLFTA